MITDRDREMKFVAWWTDHRGVFHRLARAHAETPADRADVLQEMAVQLWRPIPGGPRSLAESSPFLGWWFVTCWLKNRASLKSRLAWLQSVRRELTEF